MSQPLQDTTHTTFFHSAWCGVSNIAAWSVVKQSNCTAPACVFAAMSIAVSFITYAFRLEAEKHRDSTQHKPSGMEDAEST